MVRSPARTSPKSMRPTAATPATEKPTPTLREVSTAELSKGGFTQRRANNIRGNSMRVPISRSITTVASTLLVGTRPASPAIAARTTAPAWEGSSMLERNPTPVARKQSPSPRGWRGLRR